MLLLLQPIEHLRCECMEQENNSIVCPGRTSVHKVSHESIDHDYILIEYDIAESLSTCSSKSNNIIILLLHTFTH